MAVAPPPDMERIVLHASPRHLRRKLALNLVLLAIGAALLALDLVRWLGWALVALGGGYSLVLLRALGEETERVVIDDAGIRASMLPVGTAAPARQFIARKAVEAGLPGHYLTLVGTDGDPHAIAQVISRRVQGPGRPPSREITAAE